MSVLIPAEGVFETHYVANRLARYIQESREELRKVLWPSRKETVRSTLLVIGISIAVALFLGIIDFALNFALERVIR